MQRTAVISADERYRYLLRRDWTPGDTLGVIMLNPSTADAQVDDATIRRCIGFAGAHGCGSLLVANHVRCPTHEAPREAEAMTAGNLRDGAPVPVEPVAEPEPAGAGVPPWRPRLRLGTAEPPGEHRTCLRCGHKWMSVASPRVCPSCKSAWWDRRN